MIILCTICSDLINALEMICVTQCGHLFHYDCLNTWIVKSKSCPQCRNRVTEKGMFRVFPTTTDNTPMEDEITANFQKKLDHALLNFNKQGLELKSCQESIAKIQTVLEISEKAVKTLEEKFVHKNSVLSNEIKQLLYLKSENNELKKVQEELEIQKKNVQILQGALYKPEPKPTELISRLLAAKREFAEEKKVSAEWHSKFIQLQENFSTLMKKYEGIKNELKKILNSEDSLCFGKSNLPLPRSNSTKEIFSNTSNAYNLNALRNKIQNAESPHLNLEQNKLPCAATQYPTTSKGAALLNVYHIISNDVSQIPLSSETAV